MTPSPEPPAPPAPRLIDGPAAAPATVLLAHGAGAPMDSPFMAAIACGLAKRGWRVVRFEFPYMARMRGTGQRRAPDRLPLLLEAFRDQVRLEQQGLGQGEAEAVRPLLIGGKSMGGRVASLLVDALAQEAGVCGCLCFGYPFHPPGRPAHLRTEHLAALRTPTLILQGERDSFGRRAEVEAYGLSSRVELAWIPAGDHSFRPTRSSGLTEAENLAAAVTLADRFCHRLLAGAGTSA
jgi:predicted alpha/beta-hydrolase family hydrolase